MQYGTALRVELKRRGKSQHWLAKQLGVSSAAVNQWCKGQRKVPAARQEEIETLLRWMPEGRVELKDLPGLLRSAGTPMAFLLQEQLPEDLVARTTRQYFKVGGQEYAEWALDRWAQYLGVDGEWLVQVALGQATMVPGQLALIFEAGFALTALGEHLGEPIPQAERVQTWLTVEAAGFTSFDQVAEQARVADEVVPKFKELDPKEGRAIAAQMLRNAGHKLPTPADAVYEMWLEMNQ